MAPRWVLTNNSKRADGPRISRVSWRSHLNRQQHTLTQHLLRPGEKFPWQIRLESLVLVFTHEPDLVQKFWLHVDGVPFEYLTEELRNDAITISSCLTSYLDPQSARSNSQIRSF